MKYYNIYHKFAKSAFRLTNRFINKFGVLISKPEIIHGSPAFSGAVTQSRKNFMLKYFYDMIADIEGDVVEAGVHWGYGLLNHLLFTSKPYKTRMIYAFDSFLGHSKATKEDKSNNNFIDLGNSFAISKDDVYKTLNYGTEATKKELNTKIKLVAGWAQDSMPNFNDSNKIAFVNSDMDIYEPVKTTLESFWPKLSVGGVICVGKINNPELMGKTIAFTEFKSKLKDKTYIVKTVQIKEVNTLKPIEITYIKKIY